MPYAKRQEPDWPFVDANGRADARPRGAVGPNLVRHVRVTEIPRRAPGATRNADRTTVAVRPVNPQPAAIVGKERETHDIASHEPRTDAAEMLADFQSVARRHEHRQEIMNRLETP